MNQKLRSFYVEPTIGELIMLDGQRYELIGIEPYERKNGVQSHLLEWESHCADCGQRFTIKTGRSIKHLNRRCDLHKKSGVPVAKRRRKKRRSNYSSKKVFWSVKGVV